VVAIRLSHDRSTFDAHMCRVSAHSCSLHEIPDCHLTMNDEACVAIHLHYSTIIVCLLNTNVDTVNSEFHYLHLFVLCYSGDAVTVPVSGD
jgi:hypothetical protein